MMVAVRLLSIPHRTSSQKKTQKLCYILIGASNTFNSVNRQGFLYHIKIICPEIATFVSNCYSKPSCLFVIGGVSRRYYTLHVDGKRHLGAALGSESSILFVTSYKSSRKLHVLNLMLLIRASQVDSNTI